MFKVGQKVVCVDASPSHFVQFVPLRLSRGEIYTIRSIHKDDRLKGYGVRLEELVNPSIVWSDGGDMEWSYDSGRFRSIKKTDKLEMNAAAA